MHSSELPNQIADQVSDAVVTAGSNAYCYDQNGNMRRRTIGGSVYNLTYDAENRLTGVSGSVTASYVYDGDGNRVKETIAGVTRVFVGNHYEVDNGVVKKYYYAGATRVAENSGGALTYLLADHLGSQALTLDSAGNRLNTNTEIRYYAYGAMRYTAGSTPTSFNFTGQRRDSGSGLLFYNARWYDPAVGRFLQADTVVPEPGNPQSLNRYSYVGNQPLKYTDPTGHWTEDQLKFAFGKDWRERFFGKNAVFEGRENLLKFLVSDSTTNLPVLAVASKMMTEAAKAHAFGIDFGNIDALGARVAGTLGSAAMVGASGDAILNLAAGQFSLFLSPEAGFIVGGSAQIVGGLTVMKNLPSNDTYRGTFMAVGIVGGAPVGANVEAFWGSPMAETYNAYDKTHGGFLGVGPAADLGMYGSISYSLEAYRYDSGGGTSFPYFFIDPLTVVAEVGAAVWHDVVMHPAWPWNSR